MKKFFVAIIALISIFTLCSCSGAADESQIFVASKKPDGGGSFYSSLMIDLISFPVSNGEDTVSAYRLQIGFRSINESPLGDERAQHIGKLLGIGLRENVDYVGNYNYNDNGKNYWFYCYDLQSGNYNLEVVNSDFGFFYVTHNYKINNPDWVISLPHVVFGAVITELADADLSISVDGEAVVYRYFLGIEADIDAKNAIRVSKTVLGYSAFECVMWNSATTQFDAITFDYNVMASGFYIIAILLGAAVVVVLFVVCKYVKRNDKSIFRESEAVEQSEEQSIVVAPDVLDGQISMEEISETQYSAQGEDDDAQ